MSTPRKMADCTKLHIPGYSFISHNYGINFNGINQSIQLPLAGMENKASFQILFTEWGGRAPKRTPEHTLCNTSRDQFLRCFKMHHRQSVMCIHTLLSNNNTLDHRYPEGTCTPAIFLLGACSFQNGIRFGTSNTKVACFVMIVLSTYLLNFGGQPLRDKIPSAIASEATVPPGTVLLP